MYFFSALLCVLPLLVLSQEPIESSGDISTLTIADIVSEAPYSGDMPTEMSHETARSNGSADEQLTGVEFFNGFDSSLDNSTGGESNSTEQMLLVNGTTSTQQSSTLSSTTTEAPPTTTTTTTTTTSSPTTVALTSTTTMSSSSSTTTPTTTSTSTPTTTTTMSTTTTTRGTTTTNRPKTTSTTKRTSTTTDSSRPGTRLTISTASPRIEAPCEIIEDDFECDVEISCFGEGTIDCDEFDGNEDDAQNEEMQAESPNSDEIAEPEEYLEEEEEADDEHIEYFPPELVGKVPPKFPIVWKMKNVMDSSNASSSSESPTTVFLETSTDAATTTATSSTGEVTVVATSDRMTSMPVIVVTVSSSPAAPSASPEPENQTMTSLNGSSSPDDITPSPATSANIAQDTNDTAESTANPEVAAAMASVDVANATDVDVALGASSVNDSDHHMPSTEQSLQMQTTKETEAQILTTEALKIVTSEAPRPVVTKRKRRKRESSSFHADPSSSESLQLASQKSKSKARSCKVSGNLQCTPMPSTVFCRGKATCRMISIEKSEKSSTARGVENWAIAVIAICSTAALLTVGLLIYLIVTSWKKLKVQPQNGVTTLTYVNSTPP